MTDWESRYRRGDFGNNEPHPLLMNFAAVLKPGRALDIACGAGRHALWLAGKGWQVTAVDSSPTAIEILKSRFGTGTGLDAVVADLTADAFRIPPESFNLIIMCNYLQRDLFPSIRKGVRTGGIVIAIIAMVDDDPAGRPMNPAFLLNAGELRAEFESWNVLHYSEGKASGRPGQRKTAEIVAQRSI